MPLHAIARVRGIMHIQMLMRQATPLLMSLSCGATRRTTPPHPRRGNVRCGVVVFMPSRRDMATHQSGNSHGRVCTPLSIWRGFEMLWKRPSVLPLNSLPLQTFVRHLCCLSPVWSLRPSNPTRWRVRVPDILRVETESSDVPGFAEPRCGVVASSTAVCGARFHRHRSSNIFGC